MKKRNTKYLHLPCHIFFILLLIFSLFFSSTPIQAAACPKVHAHAYVIMDANTGKVLLSKQSKKKIYPASTVKLMTALVVLDKYKTTKKIKITKRMVKQFPSSASKVGLVAGNSYTVSDLLHMLLLPSAGDAAIVLAIATHGSHTSFARAMNQKASTLNMKHSSFDNAIGLDIGDDYYNTYGTAADFAILARYAMSVPAIRSIVTKASYIVPKSKYSKAFRIVNTNQFLSEFSYNQKLYQMIGGKTGTTKAAGSVLITTAKDQYGHEIICAFFGNDDREQMYKDIRKLLNYTFKQGKAGKLKYKKGFWDTRYRLNGPLVHKYYNQGKLPVTQRFYPEKKEKQATLLSIINTIAKSSFQPIAPHKQMTLLDFANIYNTEYPSVLVSKGQVPLIATNSAIDTSIIYEEELQELCQTMAGSSSCTTEEKIALVALLKSNLLPSYIEKNVSTKFTKEDAVVIADNLINQ